jgi:hypothetical protein
LFSSSNPTISPFFPSTAATNNPPDRPFPYVCSKSLKRAGNLKCHEGVHLPEQRKCYLQATGLWEEGMQSILWKD